MNAPNFAAVNAAIQIERDIEEDARRALQRDIDAKLERAKRNAKPLYRELAEAIQFGPEQVFEEDALLLLGALHTLILKRSHAMHDSAFIEAVEFIEGAIDCLSCQEIDSANLEEAYRELTEEWKNEERRNG